MNLLPEITCPFPSLKAPKALAQLAKDDPSSARKKLENQALLTNRIVLTVIGTYLLTSSGIFPPLLLAAGSVVSLPCTLLGTGTYFLLQGAHHIVNTSEMTNLFQNLCWGGFEMGSAALMLYFYGAAPIGLAETYALGPTASKYALTESKRLLNS